MKKSSYTFIQMNTSAHLLRTCDELALSLKKETRVTGYDNPFDAPLSAHKPTSKCVALNLSLVNIGAAVLEGALRSVLCETLQRDSEILGEQSKSVQGQYSYLPTVKSYKLLTRYRNQVELQGGWSNLKKQLSEYLEIRIDELLSKQDTSGVNGLFTLRNIAAHGTGYVTPKHQVDDTDKDSYLSKWQSKTQELSVYVNKTFNLDVLEALQHPAFSYHFFELIKKLVSTIDSSSLPDNAEMLLHNIKSYSFGYRNPSVSLVLPQHQ